MINGLPSSKRKTLSCVSGLRSSNIKCRLFSSAASAPPISARPEKELPKTGDVKMFEVPTAGSAPRRGQMDSQDRLWFAQYRGDRIAMFDTKTEAFKEWRVTPRSSRAKRSRIKN